MSKELNEIKKEAKRKMKKIRSKQCLIKELLMSNVLLIFVYFAFAFVITFCFFYAT